MKYENKGISFNDALQIRPQLQTTTSDNSGTTIAAITVGEPMIDRFLCLCFLRDFLRVERRCLVSGTTLLSKPDQVVSH